MIYNSSFNLLVFFFRLFSLYTVCSSSFNYEKMHMFGAGRMLIPNYRRLNPKADFGYGHPQPVPTSTSLPIRVRSYPNIYQGRRLPGDERVYAKAFNNTALPSGQLYHCEAFFDCIVTHLSVETKGSVPILLRGGVGYNYMHVVVRAHPNIQLNGNIRAFCKKKKTEAARTRQKTANDAEQGDT